MAGRSLMRGENCARPRALSWISRAPSLTLLSTFIGQSQRVIGRERLIELSRMRLADSSDRSIDVLVSRLRRKLSAADKPPPIVTVRGIGYMFKADVTHA
jgi:two-component system OmpR family response regulator